MIARMWEVRGYPEQIDALVSWVMDVAVPTVDHESGHRGTQVYRSAERVVVITNWEAAAVSFPDPPEDLVARAPHSWDFAPVSR